MDFGPRGYVDNSTDCDDNNVAVNPGAVEVCNTIDDNCDGQIDEGVLITFYIDADADTYGSPIGSTIQACSPPEGYVIDTTDCDDTDPEVNPGAAEVCRDGIDNNCDGQKNEGCAPITLRVPSEYSTIQTAIDSAVDGDTILVAAGTYVENINFLGKAITVRSENGPEVTIIRGNDLSSVVTFRNGEGLYSVLTGFTITHGSAGKGGGVFCYFSSPTISYCIIRNNYAFEEGGGDFLLFFLTNG